MSSNLRTPATPSTAPDRRSGFATILVLLLVFLIMIMAITYLRTMRSYNMTHPPMPAANAKPVAQQVITDLAVIIGADGNLAANEPYDYPWTCTRMNAPYRLTYPTATSGTGATGDPLVDDAWLAPTEPESNQWTQVSNPFGSFLVYTDATLSNVQPNFQTRDRVPMDAPAGAPIPGVAVDGSGNPQSVSFQSLNTSDPRLVDTDGDGVGDALWFYPKNSWSNGVRYVSAVRVVDLSGMLNINTALGELASDPTSNSGTPRKGEGPYEINAKTLLGTAIPPGSLSFRQTGIVSVPSGRATGAWNDWDYWCASGARTNDNATSSGTGSNRYSLTDEVQLRDYLNQYTVQPYPRIRQDYSALNANQAMRNRVTTMGGAYDVCAPLPYTPDRDPSNAGFARTRRLFDLYIDQYNLNQPAPPTPYPALAGTTGGSNWTYGGWYDQAWFWESWNGTSGGMPDFFRGIDYTNPNCVYPYPEGFKFLTRNATSDVRAGQYNILMGANCFQDVLGRDNVPTVASEWNGSEPLPVMTEFYAQMPYIMNQDYRAVWNWNNTTLPTTAQAVMVFPGEHLSQLSQSDIRNLNFKLGGVIAQTYYQYTQTASDITVQVQAYDPGWGPNTRCFKLDFKETPTGVNPAGVTVNVVYAKYLSGNQEGTNFDSTGTAGIYMSDLSLGLPVHTDCATPTNWQQNFINLTENRLGVGGAGNSLGDVIWNGNNLTSTTWCAAGGSAGVGSYALEFVNPYQIPIRLSNVSFIFRRYDYYIQSTVPGLTGRGAFQWANSPSYNSADLDTYINAYFAAGQPVKDGAGISMAQDGEGYYVLKPGEKVVFYRNGTENAGPGGPRTRPFGGPPYAGGAPFGTTPATTDISGLIATQAGCYKVDLTPFNATTPPAAAAPFNIDAPDLNGYPSTWNVQLLEIRTRGQWSSGGVSNSWYTYLPYQRITYPSLYAGWAADTNCTRIETNIPNGRQAAPGQLVYKQLDVRSFGVDSKLDVLQIRPMTYFQSQNQMQTDMGDYEIRTNTYDQVAKGYLDGSAGKLPFPQGSFKSTANGWSYGYNNIASTMPLASAFLQYDTTNTNTSISALGLSSKVAFPGAATTYPGPPSPPTTRVAYGTRQSIRNEPMMFNYVGIPGDANYPGTFPELAAVNNANRTIRDNGTSGYGIERRDGLRPLDLIKAPLISPLYLIHYPGDWWNGNWDYRGTNDVSETQAGGVPSPNSPLVGKWEQNTIGDAVNFYLAKDVEINGTGSGLRGLSLRTDVPWFDWANVSTKYPTLPYSGSATYTNGKEALYQGDIYTAQNQPVTGALLPAPDPTPGSGNVGAGKVWAYSNGPYARASQFWQLSWAEACLNRLQVDSPKYKGCTGSNGQNFKPGMINLNTASKEVLKCLSLPTGVNADTFATNVIANRKAPTNGASVAGGTRKGLSVATEALGANGLKSYTNDATLSSGAGTSKFYTSDTTLNLETLSWLPQQSCCRSDVFCAYIVVQGYSDTDFTSGPLDSCRAVVIFSRNPWGNGAAATVLSSSFISRRKTTDGDLNDWYTP